MTAGASPACPVAVLLGAGASVDAGLPTSVGLTRDLIEAVEADNSPDMRMALGLVLGGLAFQRGIEGRLRDLDARPDIETLLRVAQQLQNRATSPLSGFVSAWSGALQTVDPHNEGTVFRMLDRRAREVMKDKLKPPEDRTRLKYLSGVCKLPRVCRGAESTCPPIFTLNYDTCLELALDYEHIAFTTGFRDGLWSPQEFTVPGRARIYKMHGSFGWVRHPITSLVYDRETAYGREEVTFLSSDTEDDLIFATENKLQAVQPYLWMVHEFADAVAGARYVVTIGYGFGDEYVNQIIGQALAADAAKRLLVVSPSLDPVVLERTRGITFYPERIVHAGTYARKALQEEDSILTCLEQLEGETTAERPF